MKNHSKLDSFGRDRAKSYDQSNRHFLPIYENLHYLIKIILGELAPKSKILCVGSGTGTEIISLAKAFPEFSFVAVEPSESMLKVCRERLEGEGLLDRCMLVNGFVSDLGRDKDFDAAICLLVLHHTSNDGSERLGIVSGISERLKSEGYFINAELSYENDSEISVDLMEKWKSLNRISGAPEEKIKMLPKMMEEHLSIQSPKEVENMLENNGFYSVVQFFQSFLIRAWYAKKI